MCGQPPLETELEGKFAQADETVEGAHYSFDSTDCTLIFKKLRNMYGNDFFP